jgi:hypothetical protein
MLQNNTLSAGGHRARAHSEDQSVHMLTVRSSCKMHMTGKNQALGAHHELHYLSARIAGCGTWLATRHYPFLACNLRQSALASTASGKLNSQPPRTVPSKSCAADKAKRLKKPTQFA